MEIAGIISYILSPFVVVPVGAGLMAAGVNPDICVMAMLLSFPVSIMVGSIGMAIPNRGSR